MAKPVMLTSEAANLMIQIAYATRDLPSGVPCKIMDSDHAKELERVKMIERVHVGSSSGVGAVPTALGKQFVQDAIRHLSN